MFCCVGFNLNKFGLVSFWTRGFVNAIPGIILEIILIPILVIVIEKMNKKEIIN